MELVENNTYIDVPDFGIQVQSRSQVIDPAARKAMVNAALYRFYKHVEIIDSQYVCHLSGADEINVSPTTYNAMLNDLEKSNEFIRKENKLGHRVTIGTVDDDYLNSLLDDRPLQEKMQEQAAKIIQQEKQ